MANDVKIEEVETSDNEQQLEAAREKYNELFGKDVANAKKNDLAWIEGKIQEKENENNTPVDSVENNSESEEENLSETQENSTKKEGEEVILTVNVRDQGELLKKGSKIKLTKDIIERFNSSWYK